MMLSVIQDTDAGHWYMMPISVCWEKKNTEKRKIPKKDKYRKKIDTRKKNTGKEECREEEFRKKEYRKEYGIEHQKVYRIIRYLFRYHNKAKQ